jgi:hypothetical protein
LDNFTVNIRQKGLEIEQDKMVKYSSDQRVIDDLLSQVDYRFDKNLNLGKYEGISKEELELIKHRIYDKFNHDCKLWYYVKDRRPAYTDSTKDISNWILTLDFSFLEFDKFKQYIDKSIKISICLHPNEFISMLQFWVPRTEKFENAILGNFRLPFLFKEVDSESERVSVEILKALSQYEDSKTYSSDLVTEILTNKALRQKIKPSNTVEENAAHIKEEIFKKYESASKQLQAEKSNKLNLESELLTIKSSVSTLTQKIDKLHEYNKRKIEKELHSFRKIKIQESEFEKSKIKTKIDFLFERMSDYDTNINQAEKEVRIKLSSFTNQVKAIFVSKAKLKKKIAPVIHSKFYDSKKYKEIKEEYSILSKQYDDLLIPSVEEKIIIYCENQNSKYLNDIGFTGIHFFPERDSPGVFIKTVSNPTSFGLRDRDYLTDEEILKIRKLHPNYFILKYYCFENYLYHPDNIKDLNLSGFDSKKYIAELVKQKKEQFTNIVSVYKQSRNNYQEFRILENNIREKHDEAIISYLESDDYEMFLKSYDLKTKFNKSILQNYKLTQEHLTSTEWFKNQIQTLLSI